MSAVTVAEVKQLGRISTSSHDDLLQLIIDSAESFIGEYCHIALEEGTHTEKFNGGSFYLYVGKCPLVSVTSLSIYGEVIAPEDYLVEEFGILQQTGLRWEGELQGIEVEYVGGYDIVPSGLKLAIMQMTLRAYMNYEARSSLGEAGVSSSWQSLWKGNDIMALLEQYSYKTVLE